MNEFILSKLYALERHELYLLLDLLSAPKIAKMKSTATSTTSSIPPSSSKKRSQMPIQIAKIWSSSNGVCVNRGDLTRLEVPPWHKIHHNARANRP
jgi:hypothetical protein